MQQVVRVAFLEEAGPDESLDCWTALLQNALARMQPNRKQTVDDYAPAADEKRVAEIQLRAEEAVG